jgi:hypothetical protein
MNIYFESFLFKGRNVCYAISKSLWILRIRPWQVGQPAPAAAPTKPGARMAPPRRLGPRLLIPVRRSFLLLDDCSVVPDGQGSCDPRALIHSWRLGERPSCSRKSISIKSRRARYWPVRRLVAVSPHAVNH